MEKENFAQEKIESLALHITDKYFDVQYKPETSAWVGERDYFAKEYFKTYMCALKIVEEEVEKLRISQHRIIK